MTDQPKPDKDETPEAYRPPSYSPAPESDVPPTSRFDQQGYGQQPYAAQGQPESQYGQGTAGYSQPAEPFGTASQFGQQQYGAPAQYGQSAGPFNTYGQPSYYGVPPEPKGLSIASMCCGIAAFVGLGFFLLPQLAAVILGHMALKREPAGRGMAIAGLVMGYAGIALAILVIVLVVVGLAIGSSTYMYGA
jgi:hypothetical protein